MNPLDDLRAALKSVLTNFGPDGAHKVTSDVMAARKRARCGSYPMRYIAEDFGVPYDVVLCYADYARTMDSLPSMPLVDVAAHLSHWERWAWNEVHGNLSDCECSRLLIAVRDAMGLCEPPIEEFLPTNAPGA